MKTRTIEIEGQEIILTATATETRFGTVWFASNNYGEPKQNVKGYQSAEQALDVEEIEVRQLCS